jgi:hypothetical protein
MTDREFDAAVKKFEKARDAALKLSNFQLWAEDAEAIAEQLSMLIERMKAR